MKTGILSVLLGAVFIFPALACDEDKIVVSGAVLVEPVMAGRPTAGFMVVKNNSAINDRLISITSPACARTELHAHTETDGVMKMRKADGFDMSANGSELVLAPKANHIMCFDPVAELVPGQETTFTLHFDHAGDITVPAKIITQIQATPPATHDHHMQDK